MTSGPLVEARAAFLELGGRDATGVAAAIEQLSSIEAFKVMAAASLAARPQWAGLVDDLFDRPLLKTARAGLRNAFASTFTGDTLYRNVFFSFADAVSGTTATPSSGPDRNAWTRSTRRCCACSWPGRIS